MTGNEEIDVEQCIREAHESLALRQDRGASGQFLPGNVGAGKDLARSEAFWNAVQPARDAIVDQVLADLGADRNTGPETLCRLVGAYAEASLFRESMFIRLAESGGPITNKGKTRALFTAYLSALDRESKLAQTLGLSRKAKPTASLADILSRHEEPSRG